MDRGAAIEDALGDAASDESVEGVESAEIDSFLVGVARIDPEAPPPVLAPGVKIGPYEILALIGRGGMGVVYRVVDTRLGRENALKLLRRNVTDARRDRGLRREARSLAAAHHPNVATVFEVGEADGHVYLAMELVPGTTLRARIAAGRIAVEEAVRIAREIAIAVAHAHSKGIIHRDLKPENVMLTPDGAVKVLDFGIARASALRGERRGDGDVDTLEGTVMGTPGYMAPEQARGEATDARTDVYALGIVIHEMLTGARPGVLEG